MILQISDKRKKYGIGVSICLVAILLAVIILYTICSLGTGQRIYKSELSNANISIPYFSFGVEEFQDEETYSVQFFMLGSEEHIMKELINIENKKNNTYVIDQWAVNNSSDLIKCVVITYVLT